MRAHKSNISKYVNRFNRLSNSTKRVNNMKCLRRGGIKL